jgi:hypothetical protein
MITDHELKSVELRLHWIRPERSPMQSKQSNLSEKVQPENGKVLYSLPVSREF